MELHLGYETVEPYQLERIDAGQEKRGNAGQETSVKHGSSKLSAGLPTIAATIRLMARKERGEIEIDLQTTLRGVPAEAWEYRLGTYSALEWILERYKKRNPKTRRLRRSSIRISLRSIRNRLLICCREFVPSLLRR